MATTLAVEEAKLAKVFIEDRKKFVQEGLLPAMAALRANDLKETQRLVIEKIRPLFAPVESGLVALIKLQIDEAGRRPAADGRNPAARFGAAAQRRPQLVSSSSKGCPSALTLTHLA